MKDDIRKLRKRVELKERAVELDCTQAIYACLSENQFVTSDDFVKYAHKFQVEPGAITHLLPRIFRKMANPKAKLVRRTGRAKKSDRTSHTLQVWESLVFRGSKADVK